MTPIEVEMNERKALINKVLIDAQNNPGIDSTQTVNFFLTLFKELEIFKYSGNNSLLIGAINNENTTNANGFQAFLGGMTSQGITVYQYLIYKFS